MVSTRSLPQSSSDHNEHHFLAAPVTPVAASSGTPASAKVSREMRKLLIDANPSLGGSGSLKRKRTTRASPGELQTPTQPGRSLSDVEALSHASKVTSQTGHPATPRHIVDLASGSPVADVVPVQASNPAVGGALPSPANSQRRYAQREYLWFLPDDASASPAGSGSGSESNSSKLVTAPAPSASTPASEVPSETQMLPAIPSPEVSSRIVTYKQESGEGQTPQQNGHKRQRTSKVSRELRRLQIDANPSLLASSPRQPSSSTKPIGRQPPLPPPPEETEPSTRHNVHVVKASPPPLQDKRVKREMRKLQIDANPSLGGVVAPMHNSQTVRRRSGRGNPAPVDESPIRATKVKPSRITKPTSRLDLKIHHFPKDPPEPLADHILFLLADAAQEHDIVRALHGDARLAIMRDMRHEGAHFKEERVRHELEIMESWPVARESEEVLIRTLMDHSSEPKVAATRSPKLPPDHNPSISREQSVLEPQETGLPEHVAKAAHSDSTRSSSTSQDIIQKQDSDHPSRPTISSPSSRGEGDESALGEEKMASSEEKYAKSTPYIAAPASRSPSSGASAPLVMEESESSEDDEESELEDDEDSEMSTLDIILEKDAKQSRLTNGSMEEDEQSSEDDEGSDSTLSSIDPVRFAQLPRPLVDHSTDEDEDPDSEHGQSSEDDEDSDSASSSPDLIRFPGVVRPSTDGSTDEEEVYLSANDYPSATKSDSRSVCRSSNSADSPPAVTSVNGRSVSGDGLTRILEPDDDGTVPERRWKGKSRASP
ncbi:hypothetical protein ANO11243_075390 [Dothideomycetidae sp. 11243]|nr:hypothetical protein ANO11243_075390 [fungal sp. No.11243]